MTDISKERCENLVRVLVYGAEGYGHHVGALREAADLITALRERLSKFDGSDFAHDVQALMEGLVAEFPNNDRILNPHVGVVAAAVQAVATSCKLLAAESEQRTRADKAEAALTEALEVVRQARRIALDGYNNALTIGHLAERRIAASAFADIVNQLDALLDKHGSTEHGGGK